MYISVLVLFPLSAGSSSLYRSKSCYSAGTRETFLYVECIMYRGGINVVCKHFREVDSLSLSLSVSREPTDPSTRSKKDTSDGKFAHTRDKPEKIVHFAFCVVFPFFLSFFLLSTSRSVGVYDYHSEFRSPTLVERSQEFEVVFARVQLTVTLIERSFEPRLIRSQLPR